MSETRGESGRAERAASPDSRPVRDGVRFSRGERLALWTVAAVGVIGVNGTYLYGLFFVPGAHAEALGNPIALAFMVEAFLLLGLLAYLLWKWGLSRPGPGWFVGLSILGSMAFALPAVLLWGRERRGDGTGPPDGASTP